MIMNFKTDDLREQILDLFIDARNKISIDIASDYIGDGFRVIRIEDRDKLPELDRLIKQNRQRCYRLTNAARIRLLRRAARNNNLDRYRELEAARKRRYRLNKKLNFNPAIEYENSK